MSNARLQELMRRGTSISNSVADFVAFHFNNFDEEYCQVNEFCDVLKSYMGEKILVNYSGFTDSTPRFAYPNPSKPSRQERTIELGRLVSPFQVYEFTNMNNVRKMWAVVEKPVHVFTQDKGWASEKGERIELTDFVLGLTPEQTLPRNFFTDETSTDFRIELTSPLVMDPMGGPMYNSGHIKYDSQPYKSLVVGNKAVDEFLASQDLVIRREEKAEVPEI